MVGAIYAGGIVDEIRIYSTALEGIFNSTRLGHTEVAPFTNHAGSHIDRNDTDGFVRIVTYVTIDVRAARVPAASTPLPQRVVR